MKRAALLLVKRYQPHFSASKITMLFFALQASLGNFSACADREHVSARTKIIGGNPVNGNEFDDVVAFMRDELTFCSGTLIGSDLVLTAAHCFEKAATSTNNALSNIRVVIGNSNTDKKLRRTFSIVEASIHPKFWKDHRGAMDFAWVRISQPLGEIESAITPKNRATSDELLALTSGAAGAVRIVGFGLSSTTPPTTGEPPVAGEKNSAFAPLKFRTGVEFFAGDRKTDTCTGDSGGPAFIEVPRSLKNPSGRILVGVTSRGPMPCASDFEPGTYGLVSEALCWLKSSAGYRATDFILEEFCKSEDLLNESSPDDDLVMTKNFNAACTDENLSVAAHHDLIELFKVARLAEITDRETCDQMLAFLRNISFLDISNRNIRQLSWLRHAENLRTLIATDNMIKSIEPLKILSRLKNIDLRNNQIPAKNLSELAQQRSVLGLKTQASVITNTRYLELAEKGSATPPSKRALVIALRDLLVTGDTERKSRDLALRRGLNLDRKHVRSLEAIRGLENLESLSIVGNPDIEDWNELLTLQRLKTLRHSAADQIPVNVLSALQQHGVQLITGQEDFLPD
jgi:secreted trypsin-like serine protease